MKIKISLAQTHIQLGNALLNLEKAIHLISQAAENGSQLILFPELWSSGYDLSNSKLYCHHNKVILDNLSTLANDLHIAIGGTMLLEEGDKVYNTFNIISSSGKIIGKYNKTHLFKPLSENEYCQPGDHLEIVNFPWGSAGLATCYDTRFPELFRSYALKGVTMMLISAEWPISRIDHWKNLIKARAIENLAFVAAVNAAGQIGEHNFGGSSAIISPWGETLVEGTSDQEALLTAEIDLEQIDRARRGSTTLLDRRPDIYQL